MVTLKLDDDVFAALQRQASFHGQTLEEWLREQAYADAVPSESSAPASEDWQKRLRAFVAIHRPTGTPLDDSRESIYSE